MLISIIIPSYNTAHYLNDAIKSVLESTINDFEIIVIDDGSIDNTKEIVSEFLSLPNFKYVYQNNKGLAGARNAGIALAKGEYLVFLDSDDIILPDKLKLQSDFLSANKSIDLVYSLSECFIENDFNDRIKVNFPLFEGNVLKNLLNGNFIHVNSVMVRKNKVESAGCFNENYRELEDWDLWLRMSLNGSQFKCIDEVLSLVRVRKDSMTANQDKMNKAMYSVLFNFKTNIFNSGKWSIYKKEYYNCLLQFGLIAKASNFYTILKEANKECGFIFSVKSLKFLIKKHFVRRFTFKNKTTLELKKVWNNE